MGRNGLAYFRYLVISRSMGTMFARMLRCVSTTPFGSDVAPEVKMTSATSSPVKSTVGALTAGRVLPTLETGHTVRAVASLPTVSPTRIARASTISATFSVKSVEAR